MNIISTVAVGLIAGNFFVNEIDNSKTEMPADTQATRIAVKQSAPDDPQTGKQKGWPFEGTDMTWANGSDRRTTNIWQDLKYFTPSLLLDINYTHSFNNPIDNTVVGSTALTRNNEVQLSALHFGGDFDYHGARARVMTQFGTRSVVVPRNDLSSLRLGSAKCGFNFVQ